MQELRQAGQGTDEYGSGHVGKRSERICSFHLLMRGFVYEKTRGRLYPN